MQINEYPIRSLKQHNTEWMYYQMIADETGHTAYEIYENIASNILKVISEDGEIGYVRPTSLNSYHHNHYMERIRCLAAEIGIILPDPSTEIELNHKIKKPKLK